MRPVVLVPVLACLLALAVAPQAVHAVTQPGDTTVIVPVVPYVVPPLPCVKDTVRLRVDLCGPCATLTGGERVSATHVIVNVTVRAIDDPVYDHTCPVVPCPMGSLTFTLGVFPAGPVTVDLEVRTTLVYDDSSSILLTNHVPVPFEVSANCLVPVHPDTLPYVKEIRIGSPPLPICPGKPIPVLVSGVFPNSCYRLKRIELIPSPLTLIGPPILRLVVDDGACLARMCLMVLTPWSVDTLLPPLPPGDYRLPVQLAVTSCSDSIPPGRLYARSVPFQVAERCSVQKACLLPVWRHPEIATLCDAMVSPGHPAEVTLGIRSGVALAGLQGSLFLAPPKLRVTGLTPVGPAAGMKLQWTKTDEGARFVMFAEHGAPIPPVPPESLALVGVPVLRITVSQADSVPVPNVTLLGASDLLGSDSTGAAVPMCDVRTLDDFAVVAARICSLRGCDVNGDGVADVRDLVLMVHCVLKSGPCADSTAGHFDCNRDGEVSIDDVLCCARSILRGRMPDSTETRPEPGVAVELGVPVPTAGGLDLPLTVRGADRLGAARLALRFPQDRYEVAGVELAGNRSDWLQLSEVDGEQLVVGLIGLAAGGPAVGSPDLDMVLHLSLKPGHEAGGEVALADGQFSGPDGVALKVDLAPGSQTLGTASRLALSAGQPNPFSREARFTVSLPRAATVELTVHDLSGRRVALLYRGRLEAGSRDFMWNGRSDRGAAVPNGVYFVRCAAGGQVAARKVALLRGN